MFNFLFQSNLGELIAPIQSSEQQLLIAIQNGQMEKVQHLLEVQRVPANCKNPNGVTPLHMACQAGLNDLVRRLLELGADLHLTDNSSNNSLHYAARGGKIETVKLLVELGASVGIRNSSQQTAYDLATNHVVRQYLLPLQLKSEAVSYGDHMQHDSMNNVLAEQPKQPPPSAALEALMQAHSLPHSTPYSVPLAPSAHFDSYPEFQTSSMNYSRQPPPLINDFSNMNEVKSKNLNVFHPPPPAYIPPGLAPNSPETSHVVVPAAKPNSPKIQKKSDYGLIKPDGFHSSASDKVLQERYGHTKVNYNLAPPPTAAQLGFSQDTNSLPYQPTYCAFTPGAQTGPSYMMLPTPSRPSAYPAAQDYQMNPPYVHQPPINGPHSFAAPNPQIATFAALSNEAGGTVIDASSSSNSVL